MIRRLGLTIALLVTLTGAACAGHLSPKVAIDQYDRAAYTSVRSFQVAEEAAWHAKASWPTAAQHQDINAKVSRVYQLIIDTANLGVALPPGSSLSAADLAIIGNLQTVVADLVVLVKGAPPATVTAAGAIQTQTNNLVAKAKGA